MRKYVKWEKGQHLKRHLEQEKNNNHRERGCAEGQLQWIPENLRNLWPWRKRQWIFGESQKHGVKGLQKGPASKDQWITETRAMAKKLITSCAFSQRDEKTAHKELQIKSSESRAIRAERYYSPATHGIRHSHIVMLNRPLSTQQLHKFFFMWCHQHPWCWASPSSPIGRRLYKAQECDFPFHII